MHLLHEHITVVLLCCHGHINHNIILHFIHQINFSSLLSIILTSLCISGAFLKLLQIMQAYFMHMPISCICLFHSYICLFHSYIYIYLFIQFKMSIKWCITLLWTSSYVLSMLIRFLLSIDLLWRALKKKVPLWDPCGIQIVR